MQSFAMCGDPVEDVREVAVDTSNDTDMLCSIDKLDGRIANGDRDRVHQILFITREIYRKVGLQFCFARRKFDMVLAAEVKSELEEELEFALLRDLGSVCDFEPSGSTLNLC